MSASTNSTTASANVPVTAADIETEPSPKCPGCGKPMVYYGGGGGYICCDWKLLSRAGGWFDEDGEHVRDDRLTPRRSAGIRRRA